MIASGVMGYIYPEIDQAKCIDCCLCEKTCPVNHPIPELNTPLRAFAAISKDQEDLMSSTSGAASSVFVQSILKQGGIVYGCIQNNYKDISHRRIANIDEAYLLKGSKYVQSNIDLVYRSVKEDLRHGLKVLFTGTPCQIAGLRKYLRVAYDNLYLVDLVCHGVPSQRLLQENVQEILHNENALPYVKFRTKGAVKEDLKFGVFIENSNIPLKKQIFPYNNYITAFMAGIIFRKNCFSCAYAQSKRVSDVTIADFWGLEKTSSIPSDRGVSLMLVNSDKGLDLVKSISDFCILEERPVNEAILGNGQLQKPSAEPTNRDAFIDLYSENKKLAYATYLRKYRKEALRKQRKVKFLRFLQKYKFIYKLLMLVNNHIKVILNNIVQ